MGPRDMGTGGDCTIERLFDSVITWTGGNNSRSVKVRCVDTWADVL